MPKSCSGDFKLCSYSGTEWRPSWRAEEVQLVFDHLHRRLHRQSAEPEKHDQGGHPGRLLPHQEPRE